jgi:uncharacterized membrane protein HdeD (DUF308 family)
VTSTTRRSRLVKPDTRPSDGNGTAASRVRTGGHPTPVPPPPRPIDYRDVDPSGWWLSILAGVALVVLGLWLLANPFRSVVVLAVLVGVSLIVSGIVEAIARDDLGPAAWIAGGLLAVAGIAVLVWPDITLWALAALAGAGLVVAGLAGIVIASTHRDRPGWLGDLGLAILGIAVGVVVLAWPDATLVVLAVLLGVRAIGTGLVAVATGWHVQRLTSS